MKVGRRGDGAAVLAARLCVRAVDDIKQMLQRRRETGGLGSDWGRLHASMA